MSLIKKGFIVTMGMVMAISLTACGEKKEPQNQSGDTVQEMDKKTDLKSDDSEQPDADKPKTDNTSIQVEKEYFGKVKSIVGNEIDVDIAKNEALDNVQQEENEGDKEEVESGEVAASMTIEATTSTSNSETPPAEKPDKMELEYTGETKSFTIPAGMQIIGLGGAEAAMTDIKEGSVLYITYGGTEDAPVINTIQIVE